MRNARKIAKKRFRRLAAAVAGATILSSAMLPGIPLATAHASANPRATRHPITAVAPVTAPTATDTTTPPPTPPTVAPTPTTPAPAPDTTAPAPAATTPAPTTTTPAPTTPAPVPTPGPDRAHDRAHDWSHDRGTHNVATGDPVQAVRDNAGTYGFDADGRYTVLSQTDSHAVVRVRSDGHTYKVDLVQRDGNWVIRDIRGIGDENNPATYTTAGWFTGLTTPVTYLGTATPTTDVATLAANEQVLFQTTSYDNWSWNESTYPRDMATGVILQNPRLAGLATIIPNNILNAINNIDFNRQVVVYAHLGTTATRGYGIGISRIVQNGNDVTVTVRAKSPQAAVASTATKSDDLIPLDRTTLNFTTPIHINFVDQNGNILGTSTINPS